MTDCPYCKRALAKHDHSKCQSAAVIEALQPDDKPKGRRGRRARVTFIRKDVNQEK